MREPILKYYDLSPDVTAFSTTRHGGFSVGHYSSFNINPYCGDEELNVFQNRELLCKKLGIRPNRLILPHQVHQCNIKVVTENFLECDKSTQEEALEAVDALITNEKDVCIGISTADCVPILLYDNENHIAAAVHAGWRETQQRIIEKVISFMVTHFSSTPEHIQTAIGPSISKDAFEVGNEVYEAFGKAQFPMERIATKMLDKWHLDLWEANITSLKHVGIPSKNIHLAGICTYFQSNDYFSARKLTINSGRIYSGIIIR